MTGDVIVFTDNTEIHECNDGKHSCNENEVCTQTRQSYRCSCINGYSRQGLACKGEFRTVPHTWDCWYLKKYHWASKYFFSFIKCVIISISPFCHKGKRQWHHEGCFSKSHQIGLAKKGSNVHFHKLQTHYHLKGGGKQYSCDRLARYLVHAGNVRHSLPRQLLLQW